MRKKSNFEKMLNYRSATFDILNDFSTIRDTYGRIDIHGNIASIVWYEEEQKERMIMFPQLIILTNNITGDKLYYAYNGASLYTKQIHSYFEFYDRVSESTGKEILSLIQKGRLKGENRERI